MSGELLELAARLESASAPDRDLNYRLLMALGWSRDDGFAINPDGERVMQVPDYTGSLDDAITLVQGSAEYPDAKTFVVDCAGVTTVHMGKAVAHVWNDQGKHTGISRSPALALTAASLRARVASANEHSA